MQKFTKLKTTLLTVGIYSLTIYPTFAASRATEKTAAFWNENALIAANSMVEVTASVFLFAGVIGLALKLFKVEKYAIPAITIALFALVETLVTYLLIQFAPFVAHIALFLGNIFMLAIEPIMKVKLPAKTKTPIMLTGVTLLIIHTFIFARMLQVIIAG